MLAYVGRIHNLKDLKADQTVTRRRSAGTRPASQAGTGCGGDAVVVHGRLEGSRDTYPE